MRNALRACVMMIMLSAIAVAVARADDNSAKGVAAADHWLKLVDDGSYAESWSQSAKLFQDNVSSDAWAQKVGAVREPLGSVLSRKEVDSRSFTSLPGVPDGHYVIVHYQTAFKNKASAVETVTAMQDPDGDWRVAGYFIN